MARRLQMISDAVNSAGVLKGILEAALQRAAERSGSTKGVLADKGLASWKGARDILEQAGVWIARNGWEFLEGPKETGEQRGFSIMDLMLGTPAEEAARTFCYQTDKRWVAQLLQEDGEWVCPEQLKVGGKKHGAAKYIEEALQVDRGRVAPRFRETTRQCLDPRILMAGDSVLVRGPDIRVGIITHTGDEIQVQYYERHTGRMVDEGEVRALRQGAWERANLLTTRADRHGEIKVLLASSSPEEPNGETERLKESEVDRREFARFYTSTNAWADEHAIWREGEETGYHQRSALTRVRMGWEKGGKDAGYLVQQGLDLAAILQHHPLPEAGGTRRLEANTLGQGRGANALVGVEQLPTLLQQWGSIDATDAGSRMQAFSDGSKKGIRGTYGWLAAVHGKVVTGGGNCNLCWGGLDSYRTEAYGVLAVLVALHEHARLGLTIWCDNAAVVRVVSRLQQGGKIPTRCSDVWTEIREWLGRWGDRVDVQWIRGHVEKRKQREDWTALEWGNYLSDMVAEAMYDEARNMPDCAASLPCANRWRLWDNGQPASDKIYDMTLCRIAEKHIDTYMAQHNTDLVCRECWEYTTPGLGYTGTHAPHLRGMNVQRLFSKNRTQEELRWQGKCGGKSEAVKTAQAQKHCALCKSQEDSWHSLATCKNGQLQGHRKLLSRKYDDAMLRKGRSERDFTWTQKPSRALHTIVKVQGGTLVAARQGPAAQQTLRQTMLGIVTPRLMQAFVASGVPEEHIGEALRRHGEFMQQYFWDAWKIRNTEWKKRAVPQ
jgi:ribonuclease HI